MAYIMSDAENRLNGIALEGNVSSSRMMPTIDGAPCDVSSGCTIQFPARFAGTQSRPIDITLTVDGDDPIVFDNPGFELVGGNARDFRVASTCDGLTFYDGDDCILSVWFAPASEGWKGDAQVYARSNSRAVPGANLAGAANPLNQTPGIPPRAPEDIRTTAAFSSIEIEWTPTRDPGQSPDQSFRVVATPGAKTCSTDRTACTVRNLKPDTEYSLTVIPYNEWGPGEASSRVASRTLPDRVTAHLSPPRNQVLAQRSVTLSAAASTSLSGKPLTYEWDPGTGTFTAGGPTWTGEWNTPGTRTVRVRASSATGETDIATASVDVLPDAATAQLSPATAQVLTQQTLTLSAAASTSLSGKPLTYEWDPGTGTFTAGGPTWTGEWNTPGTRTVRVRASSATGETDIATAAIEVFPSSSRGPGISINGGLPFTNSAKVTLSLGWQELSSQVRLSNDGGFTPSTVIGLRPEVPWRLDDAVGGTFTKIVYARFIGAGGTEGATYFDDVIFDNTPPTLVSVVARPPDPSAAKANLASKSRQRPWTIITKASDNRTGVGTLQASAIRSTRAVQTVAYQKRVRISIKAKRALWVRVQDGATNWTGWRKAKIKR